MNGEFKAWAHAIGGAAVVLLLLWVFLIVVLGAY